MENENKGYKEVEANQCRANLVEHLLGNQAFIDADKTWLKDKTGCYRTFIAEYVLGEYEYRVEYGLESNRLVVLRRCLAEKDDCGLEGVRFTENVSGESRVLFWSNFFGKMEGLEALGMAEEFVDSLR